MKDQLFGLKPTQEISSFVGRLEHYMLILFVALFVTVMMILFVTKNRRVRKVALLASAIAILVLEILKYILKYNYIKVNSITISNWEFADINLITIVACLSVIFILSSIALDKFHPWARFANSFVFSMGTIAGALLFIYPVGLNASLPIYNIVNLTDILISATVLFVAIYIGFTDFLEVNIHDVWMAVISLGITLVISYAMYFASNRTINPMFVGSCEYLVRMGINMPFPWHILPILAAIFLTQVLLYFPFQVHDRHRNSDN